MVICSCCCLTFSFKVIVYLLKTWKKKIAFLPILHLAFHNFNNLSSYSSPIKARKLMLVQYF